MRQLTTGLAALTALTLLAGVVPAHADGWRHGGYEHGGYRGWHHDRDWHGYVAVVPPPVYYAPPPVIYAPPPVYYAPPQAYIATPGLSIGVRIP